jgi:hypothetical protein
MRSRFTFGKRQLGAKRDERGGKGPAHPGQHARPRDDVVADRGGEQPVADEHHEGHQHEDGAQLRACATAGGLVALTNCGRKAKKKIDSFGLRMLIRMR